MFIRIALLASLLAFSQFAHAARIVNQPEAAYEIKASSLTLPRNTGRSVFVRSCETCSGQRLDLTGATRFWVNNQEVTLAQIRQSMQANSDALLLVFYSVADKALTRVKLQTNDAGATPAPVKPGKQQNITGNNPRNRS